MSRMFSVISFRQIGVITLFRHCAILIYFHIINDSLTPPAIALKWTTWATPLWLNYMLNKEGIQSAVFHFHTRLTKSQMAIYKTCSVHNSFPVNHNRLLLIGSCPEHLLVSLYWSLFVFIHSTIKCIPEESHSDCSKSLVLSVYICVFICLFIWFFLERSVYVLCTFKICLHSVYRGSQDIVPVIRSSGHRVDRVMSLLGPWVRAWTPNYSRNCLFLLSEICVHCFWKKHHQLNINKYCLCILSCFALYVCLSKLYVPCCCMHQNFPRDQ